MTLIKNISNYTISVKRKDWIYYSEDNLDFESSSDDSAYYLYLEPGEGVDIDMAPHRSTRFCYTGVNIVICMYRQGSDSIVAEFDLSDKDTSQTIIINNSYADRYRQTRRNKAHIT